MIYLDHNASTDYAPSVKDFLRTEFFEKWANPSSEYEFGAYLSNEIKTARASIAERLNCSTKGLVFTSGATESINSVLSVQNLKKIGVNTIISSKIEHKATLDRLNFLVSEGFNILWVNNNSDGVLDLNDLKDKVAKHPHSLSTFLYVNNEIGTINPVKEIAEIVHLSEGLLHVDAVQALGKINISLEDIDCDFASFSGHKIGAMKGIGVLFLKEIKNFVPLLHGGGQERGFRPGTLNYPAIRSFSLALEDTQNWDIQKIESLRNTLEENLKKKIPNFHVNSQNAQRVCNTSNFSITGNNSREVVLSLSRRGVCVSTGSACTSGSYEPSHVLIGLGLSKDHCLSSIRVSISNSTTIEEINAFVDSLKSVIVE